MAMHKKSHKYATGMGVSEKEKPAMGHGEFANMPKEVHMEEYPKAAKYRGGVLDDTITGIDRTNHMAESKAQRFLSNQH